MANPPKGQVRTDVVGIISTFTTVLPDAIADGNVLKAPPLLLDSTGLAFLADRLTAYMRQHDGASAVTATELRKSGLTVSGTVSLVQQRVGAV